MPTEKGAAMKDTTIANERITALVKPEYLERIPSFVKGHAMKATRGLIARQFLEIYAAFSQEDEPSEDATSQMSLIVNDIFKERMAKHNL